MTRRPIPWIYRRSRFLIGAIALLGLLDTIVLAVAEFAGSAAALCPTTGCQQVLESPYAIVFGLPISVFGAIGYGAIATLSLLPPLLRRRKESVQPTAKPDRAWWLLFAISTATAVGSLYLMYLMLFEIRALCPYCVASAIFSWTIFGLTLAGRDWEDLGQLAFTGAIVTVVTAVSTIGIYSNAYSDVYSDAPDASEREAPAAIGGEAGAPIANESGPAEIALARHLAAKGAKEYGAYWCPHCHDQKELFGKEAFEILSYVECDPKGRNPQVEACRKAGVRGFPSWKIGDSLYEGVQSLDRLADLSGYTGRRDFRYVFPNAVPKKD